MKKKNRFTAKNVMIVITVLCVISIVFTWENSRNIAPIEDSLAYVVIPVQNGVNVLGDWLKDKVQFIKHINELEELNESLKIQVSQLQYDNKILEQDAIELERLRQLYELDQRYADYPKIGAQVIGKDPGNWYNVFIINKGEKDGLKVNMVVLAGNGLVGHITDVGPNYAKVQTIITDTCSVSAKVMRTSDICVVKGDQSLVSESAFCRVEYLDEEAKIVIGDEVVTSHLGEIYPPGILVGTITEITQGSDQMTKSAILQPAVDFKHLEEVLVINQVWDYSLEESE